MVDGGQEPLPEETLVVEEEFDLSDIMGEQLDVQVGTKEERLRQVEEQVGGLTVVMEECFPVGVFMSQDTLLMSRSPLTICYQTPPRPPPLCPLHPKYTAPQHCIPHTA